MRDCTDYFKLRALEEVRRAKRYLTFVSLLSLDLSHIDSANEIENFENLEKFHSAIRELVGKSIRETDLISDINGGKISILLLETSKDGALALSDRLKKTVKYFLCNNTKSPLNWRVPCRESCFPGPNNDDNGFMRALKDLN